MSAVPLFILAAPFSGACSLAAMLGRHPQLCALPPLHLGMAERVGDLLEIFRISQGRHADGLLRAVAQLELGAQTDAAVAQAQDWLQRQAHWSTGELLQHLAQRAAPRRLVVPDAESPLRPMDLLRLRRQLPDAAVLQLLRHPYTQGLLHAHWLAGQLFVPPDFKDHAQQPPQPDPQIGWLRSNTNLENFLREHQGAQQRTRSEDLVADAAAELARIADWLGVATDATALQAMQQPELWEFAGHGPPSAPYGLEAEVLEAFPPQLIAQAQSGARLDASLPWRGGQGFDAATQAFARACAYR